MRIIVPMAGMGKRMRPHTLTTPKPVVPVAGKPIDRLAARNRPTDRTPGFVVAGEQARKPAVRLGHYAGRCDGGCLYQYYFVHRGAVGGTGLKKEK